MPSRIKSRAISFDNTQYYVCPKDASSNASTESVEKKGVWDSEVFVSESPAPEVTLSPLSAVFPGNTEGIYKNRSGAITRFL
jgi:hypothetical protein